MYLRYGIIRIFLLIGCRRCSNIHTLPLTGNLTKYFPTWGKNYNKTKIKEFYKFKLSLKANILVHTIMHFLFLLYLFKF